MTDTVTCEFCGLEMENDPGAFYHRAEHEKAVALKALQVAKARLAVLEPTSVWEVSEEAEAARAEVRRLERKLEQVSYVGD